MGLNLWLNGKESACQSGYMASIPGLGRSPGEGNGNPLLYSCLENPMDRGAWRPIVHGVAKESDMTLRLSNNRSGGCPYKQRKFRHIETWWMHMHTEERPCTDTARCHCKQRREASETRSTNTWILGFYIPELWDTKFVSFKPLR